jgi:hypothetical protein
MEIERLVAQSISFAQLYIRLTTNSLRVSPLEPLKERAYCEEDSYERSESFEDVIGLERRIMQKVPRLWINSNGRIAISTTVDGDLNPPDSGERRGLVAGTR